MGFKEKLLKQIMSLGDKGYTEQELANKLKFRTKLERKILKSTIRELIKEGAVIEKSRGKLIAVSQQNLIKGDLRGNRRGFAFLSREDRGPDIFIPNRSLGGAMHGDTVLARLVGESEGVVVSILKQGIKRLVGTYIISGKYGFVVPDDDSYYKDIFIPFDKVNDAKPMSKVVVSIKIDPSNNKPLGTIEEVLGMSGDRNAEVISILKNYGFSDKFPEEVLRASEGLKYKEDKPRKDFRELLTITIDGEDAKDFDDAISIEKTISGYKLYVHIADVSHYVKPRSVIDNEALSRATSVYFPGSVFPMLPEAISNGVCSLRPNEDKLAVTVVMHTNKKGSVEKSDFYKSVIRSNYRMTYTEVTKILDNDSELKEKYSEVVEMLEWSRELADILGKKREKKGAINFETKESKIILDEKGDVSSISPYPYDTSNGIIEQFMVLTNQIVAKHLEENKYPCVYRIHEEPSEEKMDAFIKFIRNLGYDMDLSKGIAPKQFSELLNKIKGEPYETIINKVMLRSMQKARYSIANEGHFGLSLEHYCHFTSPIRRYPDLMVHRILKAVIENNKDDKFLEKFKRFCVTAAEISTEREIAADKSERDIDDYYKALYMTKFIGEKFDGVISGVISTGIFVALENTVEGFVPMIELPEDRYELDESNYRLVGTKYSFSIGDSVEVEIKSSLIETRNVNMTLVGDDTNHLRKVIKGAKI